MASRVLLVEQPLIKAQAKEYVRQTQERLIGAPILQQLTAQHGAWRSRRSGCWRYWTAGAVGQPAEQGYAPGNVVNLLRLLRGDLRGLDLSRLAIRQAYLAQVDARTQASWMPTSPRASWLKRSISPARLP